MLRLAVFVVLGIAADSIAAQTLFLDNFSPKLAPGWTWIREDKTAWRTTPEGLEIRIQPGNMWGGENSGKNVLVRDLPKTERPLEITVTVENKPTEQWEQVDLVAYYDDCHQVKIGLEQVDGKLTIVMGREEKDHARTLAIIPQEKIRVDLKLLISGKNITGYFRSNRTEKWTKTGECDLPGQGLPRIALQTYNGAAEKEHWAKVQSFRITTPEE